MHELVFWQTIATPHMAGLAQALVAEGCRVTYVAGAQITEDRRVLGWTLPPLDGVALRYAATPADVQARLSETGADAVHLCQGLRGNGPVAIAQEQIARAGREHWVMMEAVDDHRWSGPLKRAAYDALVRRHRGAVRGVLATGYRTADWLVARGMPPARVFPFAYFLADRSAPGPGSGGAAEAASAPFRVAFVGQFVELKRFPLLVEAMARLPGASAELVVIGRGPLEAEWRALSEARLPGRVRWLGQRAPDQVLDTLAGVDCLVLPSRHDGWGAVVSEALMAGTPAVCSERCGAAGAVQASGVGGVFPHGDAAALAALLARAQSAGKVDAVARARIAAWATSLGAQAGARYLIDILAHAGGTGPRPVEPWSQSLPCAA